jgi:hypothetical protein
MQYKHLRNSLITGFLLLAFSVGAIAQVPHSLKLRGALDASGAWNVRGDWSITIKESGKATFAAAVNMQHSDYFLMQNTVNGVSNDNPAGLSPHTHHISLANVDVTPIPGGFELTGMATVTLNGGPAPVSPTQVTIDVTGNTQVQYSNISLNFVALPGSKHFGSDPITGVVRSTKRDD